MSSEAFEASEDERLSSTVCYLCRQRKTKCDRKLPKCGFCVKAKVDCRYVERPHKRGLRAGYVSELEARIVLEGEVSQLRNQERIISTETASSPSLSSPARPTTRDTAEVQQPPNNTQNQLVRGATDIDSTINDLASLPHSFFHHLADLWFKETQIWVPVNLNLWMSCDVKQRFSSESHEVKADGAQLNRQHIQTSLEGLPSPVDCIPDIELRAVIALEISYSTQAICLGYNGRRRLSQYLKSQVLVEAMAKPSMSSLRALFIIAILDYGSDEIPSTFGLLAICRRMCENIGTFRQLLKRIEGESPSQIGPPAVGTPSGDDAIPLTWCILALDAVSSLGITWRDVSAALVDHLSSVAFVSAPDFRDSFKTHMHLCAIGVQPVHEFLSSQARFANTAGSAIEACEEMYQNLISYVEGLPDTSYTLLPDGSIDFDVNQIFTRVLSHGAIVVIYQQFVFHADTYTAELSKQRCLDSCANLIAAMRSISDADTEINNSPLFATWAFVAARFKLVLCKAFAQSREPLFDILMHAINILGRRWQYARRLDIVLRAAIIEVDRGTPIPLPAEFWNLEKTHLDISESLKSWVTQHKPSLYIGNLDGPYV